MQILIKAIGKDKSTALKELCDEYLKRIPWKVNLIENIYNDKILSPEELKSAEAALLLKGVDHKAYGATQRKERGSTHLKIGEVRGEEAIFKNGNCYKIALDENGKMLSSQEFAGLIEKIQLSHKGIAFFIGGAYGHAPELLNACDFKLSLSKMTLAHKMVRLFLIEQIYRAYSIITNHPYHK